MELGLANESVGPLALCLSATSSALSLYAMKLTKLAERRGSIDLCHAKENAAHQMQCRGCVGEIEELLAWIRDRRATDPTYEGVLESGTIHRSFAELESCARLHECVACQVIRRAFLLAQITQAGVEELYATSEDAHLFARLHCTTKHIFLQVLVGSDKRKEKSAWILCSEEPQQRRTELAVAPLDFDKIFVNLKPRVSECRESHHNCSNLKYSSSNPFRLVELLSDDMARLTTPPDSPSIRYVSLSYSWGKPRNYMENETFKRTKDLTPDPRTTVHQPFRRSLLPRTLQDAMRITEAFDVRHIWIDRLCIPKGADWNTESSKMHEIFGNAYFTLAATGANTAWDPLDTSRQAWLYYPRTCRLGAYWLSTIDMGLNDMRVHAPLFERGWVLQEERLSPRVLYWCGQRAYWSCASGDPYIEGSQGLCDNRASRDWSDPQSFLKYCYRGDAARLEKEWLDIVASYVRRTLYREFDRFIAISGVATRYLDAKHTMADTDQKEEYLAGLWRGNIARGLSWVVPGSVTGERLDDIGPSWSWASLPMCTEIKYDTQFKECAKFALLTESHRSAYESSMNAIENGALVKILDVEGHCRPFVSNDAIKVSWKGVRVSTGSGDRFDFSSRPQQPVYARDPDSGRVLTYEARRSAVIGQLDYASNSTNSVPEEKITQLLAFEIGVSSMLLLLMERIDHEGVMCCTRVGMATSEHRKDFFAGSEISRMRLK